MPTDIKVNTGAANIVAALNHCNRMAAAIALKCLTIPAIAKHTATVVFVHVSISASARVSLLKNTSFFVPGLRRHWPWLATCCWHVQSRPWSRPYKMGSPPLVCLIFLPFHLHIFTEFISLLSSFLPCSFIFNRESPTRPVKANMDIVMPSW